MLLHVFHNVFSVCWYNTSSYVTLALRYRSKVIWLAICLQPLLTTESGFVSAENDHPEMDPNWRLAAIEASALATTPPWLSCLFDAFKTCLMMLTMTFVKIIWVVMVTVLMVITIVVTVTADCSHIVKEDYKTCFESVRKQNCNNMSVFLVHNCLLVICSLVEK